MKTRLRSVVSIGNKGGGESPHSFPELLHMPLMCQKCHRRFAILNDECQYCHVEDEPDTELIYRDDR
jgi:hypothetical protein